MTQLGTLRRSDDVLTSDLRGETVLLNPETGDCYSLTGVGAALWDLVGDPSTFDQLVSGVCQRFEVEPTRARMDTERFLESLIDEGLVVNEPLA